MAALSAEQVAQVLYQAGARGSDLEFLVAVGKRESGYQPAAHRTDSDPSKLSGDRGLFQINSVWDQQLINAGIIKSKQDLFDPVKNAQAAMYVLQKQGRQAWGMGSGGWTAGGDPLRGTNVQEAQAAVARAQQAGMLGQPYSGGTSSMATAGAQSGPSGALPSDTKLIRVNGFTYAVYDVGGTSLRFVVSDPSMIAGKPVQNLTTAQFAATYAKGVNGGDAKELVSTAATFGTFRAQWDSIVAQVMGSNNPAVNDPGVQRVLAEFAGRPDMSTAELQNKLRATPYWQARTEGELQWNSLSEAERVARRNDTAAKMTQTWFEFTGTQMSTQELLTTRKAWVEGVASGKVSYSAWTEAAVKPRALQYGESPWSRQVRSEQETQRQRGIDIENTALNLRQTLERWGLQWDDKTVMWWAQSIIEKRNSDDDFLNTMKDQAMVKYGAWKKNRDMETMQEASPWIDTYSRVMEQQGTLFTSDVAEALNKGVNLWDFERGLKKKPAWQETKNGQEAITQTVGNIGQMFGFSA